MRVYAQVEWYLARWLIIFSSLFDTVPNTIWAVDLRLIGRQMREPDES